jgi:hypothetical protein
MTAENIFIAAGIAIGCAALGFWLDCIILNIRAGLFWAPPNKNSLAFRIGRRLRRSL